MDEEKSQRSRAHSAPQSSLVTCIVEIHPWATGSSEQSKTEFSTENGLDKSLSEEMHRDDPGPVFSHGPDIIQVEERTDDFDIASSIDDSGEFDESFVIISCALEKSLLQAEEHRELHQKLRVSLSAKDLAKLTIGFGWGGVARMYWNEQTRDMSPLEKIEFFQKEKGSIKGSKALRSRVIRRRLDKEIEQCEKEFQGYKKIFDNAMKSGYVSVSYTVVLIVGPAGVGKTCIKHLMFGLPAPKIRNSTALKDAPLCAVRDTTGEQVRDWKPVKGKSLMSIVAETVKFLGKTTTNLPKRTMKEFREIVSSAGSSDYHSPPSESVPTVSSPLTSPTLKDSSSFSSSPEVASLVTNAHESFIDTVNKSKGDTVPADAREDASRVLGSNWIYFIDSGGQPHFHNLMPHFIQGMSIVLVVLRLSDRLDSYPIADYYDDGESIGSYKSPLTVADTLRHLVRSMQSLNGDSEKPKLMFIGTFYDKIQCCTDEGLDEKNAILYDLFSDECLDQLIFSDDRMNQLIFPVNATDRSEQEEEIAQLIRSQIDLAPASTIDVPIWWYALKVILENVSVELGRNMLSKVECLDVARKLNFGEKELVAALKFFHNMHQFHYYPQILPDVIFISPQVLLDKLTELIKEAYRLRGSSSKASPLETKVGGLREFRDKGIITSALLSQDRFQKHYSDKIFSPRDLLILFIELLIITPLSPEPEIDFTRAQFFMPSLLDMLPSADLEEYRCFGQLEPLVILFPSGSPRSGVFCCLQVHLIREQKWNPVITNGKPEIIAQNCIMLSHPTMPCLITLIDSFSYIEVHVNSKLASHKKALPQIRKVVLDGIQAANKALRYDNEQPQITFFCPCNQAEPHDRLSGTPQRHIGNLKEGNQLQCSVRQTEFFSLNERYTAWLGKVISDWTLQSGPGTGVFLDANKHLPFVRKAIYKARHKWLDIGRELSVCEDDLISINHQYSEDGECLFQMLRKWMQGGEATIENLLEALESPVIEKNDVAKEVRELDHEYRIKIGFQD